MFLSKLNTNIVFKQIIKFNFASKPLPAETYYPVVDTRTYQIHKYNDKIINIGNKINLSKNSINLRKKSKKNRDDIHQGKFKDFLINQIKQDSTSLVRKKEILLVGRSNVGKSSLINNLFGIKDLSLVSSKTGSTQKLKYYELEHNYGYLIDTPGYGYSKINVEAQRKNQGMILDYLKISTRCVRIFMLINAEHGIQVSDMAFLYRTAKFNLNTQIILTKSDKVEEAQLNDKILAIGMQLKRFKHINPIIHATSNKDKFGIQHLKNAIAESLMFYKQREIPPEKEEEVIKFLERKYQLKQQYLDRKCLEYYTKTKPMQKLMQLEEKKQLKKSLVLQGTTPYTKKQKLFIQK